MFGVLYTLLDNIINLDEKRILFIATDKDGFFEAMRFYNLDTQLFKEGIDSNGKIIGYYSRVTEDKFNSSKKAGTPYTLKDSGEFYSSFDLIVTKDSIFIDMDRDFDDGSNIFDKYGLDIIGLTDDNHNEIIKYLISELLPILVQEIQEGL